MQLPLFVQQILNNLENAVFQANEARIIETTCPSKTFRNRR